MSPCELCVCVCLLPTHPYAAPFLLCWPMQEMKSSPPPLTKTKESAPSLWAATSVLQREERSFRLVPMKWQTEESEPQRQCRYKNSCTTCNSPRNRKTQAKDKEHPLLQKARGVTDATIRPRNGQRNWPEPERHPWTISGKIYSYWFLNHDKSEQRNVCWLELHCQNFDLMLPKNVIISERNLQTGVLIFDSITAD